MTTYSSNDGSYAAGIDLGGTKTLVGIVDAAGRIAAQEEFPTQPEYGPERVSDRAAETLRRLAGEASVPFGMLRGVGVASAGVLDTNACELRYARNLGWRGVPLGPLLGERLGLPVRIGNDANLAAVAEAVWGSGMAVRDLAYITVSTGIGAGIVSGGRLVEGATGMAGELGHMTIDANGPRCACGNYGCLENYGSGTAIAATARERLRDPANAPYLADFDPDAVTAREIGEAAEAGHPFALPIMEEAGFCLGNGIVALVHLFNLREVVIGGSVASGGSVLFEAAVRTFGERAIPDLREEVRIRRSRLGKAVGMLGAAGLFYIGEGGPAS